MDAVSNLYNMEASLWVLSGAGAPVYTRFQCDADHTRHTFSATWVPGVGVTFAIWFSAEIAFIRYKSIHSIDGNLLKRRKSWRYLCAYDTWRSAYVHSDLLFYWCSNRNVIFVHYLTSIIIGTYLISLTRQFFVF